jgi:hypothetical protein
MAIFCLLPYTYTLDMCFPSMLPCHHRPPDRVSVNVLASNLGSPTLLASCPPRYQNLAGACPNFTQQHQQTIHNTITTIIHHHGTPPIHPPSSVLPPHHHAHLHARLSMPPRPLRVHSSRSAQAALKSRSTSTTSKTSSADGFKDGGHRGGIARQFPAHGTRVRSDGFCL